MLIQQEYMLEHAAYSCCCCTGSIAWWRHQMETFSALLALCAGNSPRSPVNSPHKGQWRGALIFSLISALSKQSTDRWFETPSRPLWRHRNYFMRSFNDLLAHDNTRDGVQYAVPWVAVPGSFNLFHAALRKSWSGTEFCASACD